MRFTIDKKLFEDYWNSFEGKGYLGQKLSFVPSGETKGAALFGEDSETTAESLVLVLFNNVLSEIELSATKGIKIDIFSKKWRNQQLSALGEIPEYKKESVKAIWEWLVNYLGANK